MSTEQQDLAIRKWMPVAALDIVSRCGYGNAKTEELARDVKRYPKKYRKKLLGIAKAIRNKYKREGVFQRENRKVIKGFTYK